jgi:hypothetical protein
VRVVEEEPGDDEHLVGRSEHGEAADIQQEVQQRADHDAEREEREEAQAAERLLDDRAEHPEPDHVEDEVRQVHMQQAVADEPPRLEALLGAPVLRHPHGLRRRELQPRADRPDLVEPRQRERIGAGRRLRIERDADHRAVADPCVS